MAAVKPSQLADAKRCLADRRARLPDLGFTDPELAMIVFADALEDCVASCVEMSRLLAALRGSKKLTLSEEQHKALQEPYARAVAAITNAGGTP